MEAPRQLTPAEALGDDHLQGREVLVVGMARSGIAVARFLARAGARVTCNDAREDAALSAARSELADLDLEWVTGGHPDDVFREASLVVVSPGVPASLPGLTEALSAGAEVIGEVELAWRHLSSPLVAITGTNGKSTTTAWCAEMLRQQGLDVFMGGNIGTPLIGAALREKPPDVVVAEISSFQLEWVLGFRPRVAAVTNIAPDHLDRHGTASAYESAKLRLFARQVEGDAAITPERYHLERFQSYPGDHFRFKLGGLLRPGAGEMQTGEMRGDIVLLGMPATEAERYEVAGIRLPGPHNRENAMVALLCARLAGASPEAATRGLHSFDGLPHRLQLVAEAGGVRWYNDSKATNVDAAVIAARSFTEPVIWIAGGLGKGASYAPLIEALGVNTKQALLIGDDAATIREAVGDSFPVEDAGTVDQAVARAAAMAEPGDIVLFSPACASFDQFKNFEARGEVFAQLALEVARRN